MPPSRAAALTIVAYCDSSLPPQRRQREVPDHALRAWPSRHIRDDRLCDFFYFVSLSIHVILAAASSLLDTAVDTFFYGALVSYGP